MADLIDILCVFWVILALAVYVIGNFFEKQLENQKKTISNRRDVEDRRTRPDAYRTNLDDFWPQQQQATNNYRGSSDPHWQPNSDSNVYNSAYNSKHLQNESNYINNNNYNDYINKTTARTNSQFAQDSYNNSASILQANEQGNYYSSPLKSSVQLDDHQLDAGYHQSAGLNLGGQAKSGLNESAAIPTASGFNSDCVEWVNSILYLFYTQTDKYGPIIIENVSRSLNEKLSNLTSSSSEYSNLQIEFDGINSELSSKPELTNIRTEIESDKSISATCKIYNKRISFNLTIRRLTSGPSATTGPAGSIASGQQHHSHAYLLDYGGTGDGGEDCVVRYELVLENLEGKLKSIAMLSDKLIVVQFIEKPDTKILLRQIPSPSSSSSNAYYSSSSKQVPRNDLIREDVLVQMILQTLTQVVVDLYFGNDVDFPQYRHNHHHHHNFSSTYSNYKHRFNNMIKGSASELKRQIKSDFFGSLSSHSDHHGKERKVFVKIIRAKNINYNQNVTCLMELDVPRQQAVSSTKQGSNPYWDEHFLFNVNDKSTELTFELWDSINLTAAAAAAAASSIDDPSSSLKRNQQGPAGKTTSTTAGGKSTTTSTTTTTTTTKWQKSDLTGSATAKFLGLARVPIDELRQNPLQKVSLTLQPIGSDLGSSVGGELQLELLFLEHSANNSASTSAPSPQGTANLHKSNSLSSLAYQHGDIVSIDRKLTPSGYVITTTTITKQPAQSKQRQQQYHEQLLQVRNQSPVGSSSVATEHSFDDTNLDGISASRMSGANCEPAGPADRQSEGVGGRLSRSRSRSRSFLRAIKKRFSLTRTRSRSVGEATGMEPGAYRPDTSQSGGRLDAADFDSRSRTVSEVSAAGADDSTSRAKSMPPASRDASEVPTIVINKSRLSDTASAFTFTHPKSQLVIEVLEPTMRADGNGNSKTKGVLRYYAIPDDAANKRKWRRRGTKLHLFNEHQFVACHLAGSSTCHLCGRVFSRRPGKQGYKCRNCHLLSHKQCHVKVDHNCPYAARDALPLEYIDADPPASLVDELMSGTRPHSASSGDTAAVADPSNDLSMMRAGADPYQAGRVRSSGSRSGRPNMRMTAKSISMEVEDR